MLFRSQRIDDAAEGDLHKKPLGARNGYEREVVWEYPRPIGNEVILREGRVGVAARHHLGKIAMHDADATREVRRLRGEELVGRRLSDQIVDRGTVPGAGFRLARRLRQRDPPTAARDIDEAMKVRIICTTAGWGTVTTTILSRSRSAYRGCDFAHGGNAPRMSSLRSAIR